MLLGDYYLHDPRVVLIPIEGLTASGATAELAAFLEQRCAWSRARIDLFDRGFALYWQRSSALAGRTRTWPAPRRRHVAVVTDADGVRPYAQMLNTSAWTLYADDLEPQTSHPEFVAYLLAHGDRMSVTGEVTAVGVHTAAWWFERDEAECAAFSAAAQSSARPDADGLRAIAAALPWLRQLRHESLRPPVRLSLPGTAAPINFRPIPNTGLFVPLSLEKEPPALVETWKRIATTAVATFHTRWKAEDRNASRTLFEWLESTAPSLLVTGRQEAILWDPEHPGRLGPLRQDLRQASGAGVRDIDVDLRLVDEHSRRFLASLRDPGGLPKPLTAPLQHGYTYLHRERRLIAYNLHETWTERLAGPALPFARAMLGARTIHEWCHLAVDAGWVPQTATETQMDDILGDIGERLDAALRDAPLAVRSAVEPELRPLGPRPGRALAAGVVERFADYRANLLAQRYLTEAERETYVRQNIRTLRGEYRPAQVFRMLARYLYEFQYLRFSRAPDPRAFFLHSTWFDDDFFGSRILDQVRFDALATAVGRLCEAYAVDELRFIAV